MLETDATTARKGATAAIHRDLAAQDANGTEADVASDQQTTAEETGSQASSPDEATSDASTASEAGTTDASAPDRAAQHGSEIELKLLVDADRLTDFNAAAIISVNARNKGARKHLRSA